MTPAEATTPVEQGARMVCATLREAGHEAYFAGGCVRDMLLGRPPADIDIATSATPVETTALFPRTAQVGAEFGTVLVILPEGQYEVTTFRSDGPYLDGRRPARVAFTNAEQDALRRDFTINALFYAPDRDEVVDYAGGQTDLRDGVIRAVGDPQQRFAEDHLRLARAVRFAARLGFTIEPATFRAIREHASSIRRTSAERVAAELLKMLTEGAARRAFELLDATGLLEEILPEVAAMKGVEQPPEYHPEGDVFVHTLLALEHVDRVANPSPALALGVLLHDVGKPPTQTFEDRIRFNRHEKVGAEMARRICQRLRLPRRLTERVEWLVEQHMRVARIPEMRESKRIRFVREPGFPELLELARIDALASHGGLGHVDRIADYMAQLTPEAAKPAPLLTGKDLIAMGHTPGPLFGTILAAVEDAQLEGALTTSAEARAFVAQHWPLDRHGNVARDRDAHNRDSESGPDGRYSSNQG